MQKVLSTCVRSYNILFYHVITGIFLVLTACNPADRTKPFSSENKVYFDLPQILQYQIFNHLKDALYVKKITTDTIAVKITDWSKELAPFLAIDLNKPRYRGAFKAGAVWMEDSTSKIVYVLKSGHEADIRQLTVEFDKAQKLQRIRARSRVDKWLYFSEKYIYLEFEPADDAPVGRLSLYALSGKQGFVGMPENHYEIRCNITYAPR